MSKHNIWAVTESLSHTAPFFLHDSLDRDTIRKDLFTVRKKPQEVHSCLVHPSLVHQGAVAAGIRGPKHRKPLDNPKVFSEPDSLSHGFPGPFSGHKL